jgi:hypothetical protein
VASGSDTSSATTGSHIQKVVVTGSNMKRTDTEGTSPVSVMTAQDIKNTGAASVSDLMKFIPSMGTDSNQDFQSGSGFAKGVATASLRGLGSSSTLVLLNGRRVTPAPYADPNDGNSVLYDLNDSHLGHRARRSAAGRRIGRVRLRRHRRRHQLHPEAELRRRRDRRALQRQRRQPASAARA